MGKGDQLPLSPIQRADKNAAQLVVFGASEITRPEQKVIVVRQEKWPTVRLLFRGTDVVGYRCCA
jgi:hypothetical protein